MSALSRRAGILQGRWNSPTRKRRKRRAPLACAAATLNNYFGNADGTEPLALARSPGRRPACPTFRFHRVEGNQNDGPVLSLKGGRIFSPSRSNILRSAA